LGYFTIGLETKRPLEIDVQAFSSADQIADYQMALLIEVRNVTGDLLWDGKVYSCRKVENSQKIFVRWYNF